MEQQEITNQSNSIHRFETFKEEILRRAKKATIESLMKLAGQDPKGIGWEGDFDSMSLKTVLRNLLSKYGFLSIEMQNAIASDSEVEAVQPIQAPQSQPPVIDIDNEDVSDKKEDEPKTEEKPPYM